MERRLAAILAADVVGYSRLMGKDEGGTLERLKSLRRELVQPKITEHKGRSVASGDAQSLPGSSQFALTTSTHAFPGPPGACWPICCPGLGRLVWWVGLWYFPSWKNILPTPEDVFSQTGRNALSSPYPTYTGYVSVENYSTFTLSDVIVTHDDPIPGEPKYLDICSGGPLASPSRVLLDGEIQTNQTLPDTWGLFFTLQGFNYYGWCNCGFESEDDGGTLIIKINPWGTGSEETTFDVIMPQSSPCRDNDIRKYYGLPPSNP